MDELLTLSLALNVAPVHLLVPVDGDSEPYQVTSTETAERARVRAWIRGNVTLAALPLVADSRQFYAEQPASDIEAAARSPRRWRQRGRGQVSIRKLPNGRWEARIRVDGRHLKKTFERKTDATAWESTVRHDRDRGLHVDMTNRVTVAEYFTQWMGTRVIRPNSRDAYLTLLRVHLEPVPLGARPLVRVRPSEIQAWASSAPKCSARSPCAATPGCCGQCSPPRCSTGCSPETRCFPSRGCRCRRWTNRRSRR